MDNELFGEAHEQEENGLFGKRHQAEQLNLCAVSGCTCKIPEPRMKNSENGISAYCVKCTKQYYR
mgnify:CR=1 FL=1